MTTTVMKLGTMVLWGEALQTIPVWVTFIQGHGHSGWLKILKNSNIDIFSDAMTPTVMKLDANILCGLAFQAMAVSLTFIQGHNPKGWWKLKKNIGVFSNTIITTVILAGTVVVCCKAFHCMPVEVTFNQGHRDWRKIFESLYHGHFLIHYHHYSHLSWQVGIPWQDLSEHTSLGDLYPRTRSQGKMET